MKIRVRKSLSIIALVLVVFFSSIFTTTIGNAANTASFGGGVATPAQAGSDLRAFLVDPANSGTLITLDGDVNVDDQGVGVDALVNAGDYTIDLNGYTLSISAFSDDTNAFKLNSGTTLTIQDTSSAGTGKLIATHTGTGTNPNFNAAINTSQGSFIVLSGTIEASAGQGGAGIGGGTGQPAGNIDIRGGNITAEGIGGAGIGGGTESSNLTGNISITGGTVVASSQNSYGGGAGIGGGWTGSPGTIVIGGSANVTASGDSSTTEIGYGSGAGIGSGSSPSDPNAGSITIKDNAVVLATGGSRNGGGAGIGGGSVDTGGPTSFADAGSGTNIIIQDQANVTAQGGGDAAGIGGGGSNITDDVAGNGGTITISGTSTVVAKGSGYGSGIGGGGNSTTQLAGDGATLSITGSTVSVEGGANSLGAISSGNNVSNIPGSKGSSTIVKSNITFTGSTGNSAVNIDTTTLPNGTLGSAYSQTLSTSGSSTPYTFTISGGTLPSGLSLNSSTGEISGTPTASGAFTADIKINDGFGSSEIKEFVLTINTVADKDITGFSINGVNGTITGTNINVVLPFGTDVTNLTPVITHTGSTVSDDGVAKDFSSPVTYTVTALDASTQTYTVTVNVASSPGTTKDITSFSINGINGTITGTNINVVLPFGTDVTNLTPVITHTGATVSDDGVAKDFSSPVTYTVTAGDGSTQNYTVTVSVATSPSTSKDITSFSINGVNGTIIGTNINVVLPFGTDVTNLTPVITHTGATVSDDGVAKDFSSPVTYTVTAGDGSTQNYTVAVSVVSSPNTSKDITSFSINGVSGVITGTTITITLPSGTNITSLTPFITHIGASVSDDGVAKDFSSPVIYTVTALDGSTQNYTVIVSLDSYLILGQSYSNSRDYNYKGSTKIDGSSIEQAKSNIHWLTQNEISTALGKAKTERKTTASIQLSGITGIYKSRAKDFGIYGLVFDTMENNKVQVRVTLSTISSIKKDILLSGSVNSMNVKNVSKLFSTNFTNLVSVIQMDQQSDWGQQVKIAAKVSKDFKNDDNIVIYNYNAKTNTYKKLNTTVFLDENGYVHFYTTLGGTFIVSNNDLAKK